METSEVTECLACGAENNNGSKHELCDACLKRCTCENCGKVDKRNVIYYNRDGYHGQFCSHDCFIEYHEIFECAGCYIFISNDDYGMDGYCISCYEPEGMGDVCRGYQQWNPSVKLGDSISFGMEIEVEFDNRSECQGSLDVMFANMNNLDSPYSYLCTKEDCSVNGYEIVTGTFQHAKPRWKNVVAGISNAIDGRGIDFGDAGIHIHVSRESFGDDYEEQRATIAKVVFIYERFYDDIVKYAGRTRGQVDEWARSYEIERYGDKVLNKKSCHDLLGEYLGRYYAVNLSNSNTVEFRIFNSSTQDWVIRSFVDLTAAIVNVARYGNERSIWRCGYLRNVVKEYLTEDMERRFNAVGTPKPRKWNGGGV